MLSPTARLSKLSFFSVKCSDNSGSNFIIKDDEGWQASACVKCSCKEGNMSCQKETTVFFPFSPLLVYKFEEICTSPSCNVLHFLSAKGETCEGISHF